MKKIEYVIAGVELRNSASSEVGVASRHNEPAVFLYRKSASSPEKVGLVFVPEAERRLFND